MPVIELNNQHPTNLFLYPSHTRMLGPRAFIRLRARAALPESRRFIAQAPPKATERARAAFAATKEHVKGAVSNMGQAVADVASGARVRDVAAVHARAASEDVKTLGAELKAAARSEPPTEARVLDVLPAEERADNEPATAERVVAVGSLADVASGRARADDVARAHSEVASGDVTAWGYEQEAERGAALPGDAAAPIPDTLEQRIRETPSVAARATQPRTAPPSRRSGN